MSAHPIVWVISNAVNFFMASIVANVPLRAWGNSFTLLRFPRSLSMVFTYCLSGNSSRRSLCSSKYGYSTSWAFWTMGMVLTELLVFGSQFPASIFWWRGLIVSSYSSCFLSLFRMYMHPLQLQGWASGILIRCFLVSSQERRKWMNSEILKPVKVSP